MTSPTISHHGHTILQNADSVMDAYRRLRGGDRSALARIIEEFSDELLRKSGWKLFGAVGRVVDAQDPIQDAMLSFWWRVEVEEVIERFKREWHPRVAIACYLDDVSHELRPRVADILLNIDRALQRGERPPSGWVIRSRTDLMRLISSIVLNKTQRAIRFHLTKKRGAGGVRGDSAMPGGEPMLANVAPSPEQLAEFRELCDRLVLKLPEKAHLRNLGRALLQEGEQGVQSLQDLELSEAGLEASLGVVFEIWESEIDHILEEKPIL